MPTPDADVAVLGAGPAGAIAARELARTGISTLLIDPDEPRPSHAIESFPPSGAPLAEELGLIAPICAVSYGPAQSMQMHWRAERERQAFGDSGPLLLHRADLHRTLRDEALRSAPEQLRLVKARVRKVTPGPQGCLIDAGERRFDVRMVLDARGRSVNPGGSDLVALPFTAQRQDCESAAMQIEALERAWVWAACLPDGSLSGALFLKAGELAGTNAQSRTDLATALLAASETFADLHEITTARPAPAGLAACEDPVFDARVFAIGDAALARDPIASHGLVHAMRSAVQAAAAVRTCLDNDRNSDAALAFLRLKHAETTRAAREATARAYGDQALFDSDFWRGGQAEVAQASPEPSSLDGPVGLARPLGRAPQLNEDHIRWAPAIELPEVSDYFLSGQGITALEVATACRPAAPIATIATRLGRSHDPARVADVLGLLVNGGAFAQAATSV